MIRRAGDIGDGFNSVRCKLATLCLTLALPLAIGLTAHAQQSDGTRGEVDTYGRDVDNAGEFATPWFQTRTFFAEEAIQAASADEQFVYAISNQIVAKYSRASGDRIAVSHGEAKHLNSGFFWKGKLYCAHSNYPRKPEQSQIKVLDPESMQLSTYKDFGDFGGSLTWALRHDDHWWCNFAYYGEDNNRTTLVKFDNDWQPQARFTYPRELIRDLGQYSLSGGVWRGNDLVVTGHDDRVLFRLRLPTEADTLQYVDRQDVPFTGQGIANDPVTGGLIGIQRSKRLVVFAEQEPHRFSIRVLSYNIHHAEGVDKRLDLERIARTISSVNPDVVMLQEVDRNTRRADDQDQPAELARMTNMHVVFGDNILHDGGKYGNAILSRFPIIRHQNHLLPNLNDGEQRGLLEVEVQLQDNSQQRSLQPSLILFGTHLDHRRDDAERMASAVAINARILPFIGTPAVLAGDLNDTPASAPLIELGKQWRRANDEVTPTIPVGEPTRQIDYILYHPAKRWRVVETKVLDEAVASDHRAIFAVLELSPPDS